MDIDYHDEIITTGSPLGDYGHIDWEKDVGKNGVNPHILAQEIVTKIKGDVSDWSKYDLNDDGWVDRFLILHCTTTGRRRWGEFENMVALFFNRGGC